MTFGDGRITMRRALKTRTRNTDFYFQHAENKKAGPKAGLKNNTAAKKIESYFFSGAAGAGAAASAGAAGAVASAGLAASAAGAAGAGAVAGAAGAVAGASAFFSQAATAVMARRAASRIEYFFMINTFPCV
jgi:hypothetical protein